MSQWWSWGLFVNGVIGMLLALHRPRFGAWYNIVGQTGWITYGTITHQWGFLVQGITYTIVFGHLRWKHRRQPEEQSQVGQADG